MAASGVDILIASMTGYARAQGSDEQRRWVWEARSVNGRNLAVRFRGPPGFDNLERLAREAAQGRFQRGQIGDHVRECWTKDAGALDIDKQRVLLTVTTDGTGVVRKAEVSGDDTGRLGDPRFRAFAERAIRAVMDVRCANLPLPPTLMGKVNVLTFRFSP